MTDDQRDRLLMEVARVVAEIARVLSRRCDQEADGVRLTLAEISAEGDAEGG